MSWRLVAALAAISITAWPTVASADNGDDGRLGNIKHIVVVYEENHSFDNLYGGWEGVNGRPNAAAAQTIQVGQTLGTIAGAPYTCLMQNDVNLTSLPLPADCTDTTTATPFTSHFPNAPFNIADSIPADARTCPQPGVFAPSGLKPSPANLPGGCTRDIVHRFYQEQYQLNNGAQNLYVTGSDAVGLAMGYYDTRTLPIYAYLHGKGHPNYAISDNFFQSAFGGSFLNHQWLVAAATPTWIAAPVAQQSIIDTNGMPNNYALYHATTPVLDKALTVLCPSPVPGRACGSFAVNTIQPAYQPFKGTPQLPPQRGTTIGDELSTANVSWAWYSGGWSNADGDVGAPGWTNGTAVDAVCTDPNSAPNPTWPNCPNKVFQYHHQPLNYYLSFAPGTPGRTHLRDEVEFNQVVANSGKRCKLNSVSFVKPIGLENEHPGYTSVGVGSNHLVELLKAIDNSSCRKDTMVVVTYDEFGGQWDHVTPPGQGGTPGPSDMWGPGTRIPALIIAPHLRGKFVVDHTQYDTTSILATIEHRYGLLPLGTRDGAVKDLGSVFTARSPEEQEGGSD